MPYVRLTGTRLKFWDANGAFAVGYKLWQVAAGTTDTLITTYGAPLPDGSIGAANDNPIILPINGECDVCTFVAVKLCFCLPTSTGPTDGIIESVDWLGQQEGVSPLNAIITGSTTHNNYVATTTTLLTALIDKQMFILTPDVDSLPTVGATDFTGHGINDIIWSGPFLGTTPAAVFQVEMIAVGVLAPTAPTAALSATAGVVTAGDHQILITFVTPEGETVAGVASTVVTADGSHGIDLSAIPVAPAGQNVSSRNIYLTKAAGSTYYLAANIADNTTVTLFLNIADGSLPTTQPPATNTTGDGTGVDKVQWRKDGGAWIPASLTDALQITIEGMGFTSAQKLGHYVGDIWTSTVETPVRLDLDGLGKVAGVSPLVYKIIGGQVQALGKGDWLAGYAKTLVWNEAQNCWIDNNPSLPVYSSIVPARVRREIYGDYTITTDDWGREISCNANCTIAFPALSTLPSQFCYIHPGAWTVIITTLGAATDVIIPPFSNTGVTSFQLYIGGPGTVQLGNNGSSLHVLTQVAPARDYLKRTAYLTAGTFTWTKTLGYNWALVEVEAGGAGGSGGGGAGGAGGRAKKVIDISAITSETVIVGAAGVGNTGTDGTNGGTSSFGSLVSASGGGYGHVSGAGGLGGTGTGGDENITGESGTFVDTANARFGRGGSSPNGAGGQETADSNGNNGRGNGAGGGGGATKGGDGAPGLVIVTEYR